MSDSSIPTIIAGLLCDQIITEAQTNKKTLVGIFDRVYATSLPFTPQIWLFIRMTDLEGRYRFKIELLHLESEKPIAGVETDEVEVTDRLGFHEIAIRLPLLGLPNEGTYEFQIYANDVYIGRIVMKAELRKGN